MDLSVSPDIEAYLAYVFVIILGAITAYVQVSRRLGNLAGIWFNWRTWWLCLLYALVPVGLFWFLDRTSAITDTSLFAAILIGVGYERIMDGSSQTLRAPGDLSKFWAPLLAYSDKVSQILLEKTQRRQARVTERIVFSVLGEPPANPPDPNRRTRYDRLQSLGLRFAADPAALQSQLNAIDTAANRGLNEKLEDKTRLLLSRLAAVPDIDNHLLQREVITPEFYRSYIKRWPARIRLGIALAACGVAIIGIIVLLIPDRARWEAEYYIWRLSKINSTSVDQHRSRYKLSELMRDPKIEADATKKLAATLRQHGLPVERVDLILQTLLETRAKPQGNPDLPTLLIHSLRSGSVDARTRINDVLKYMQSHCREPFDESDPIGVASSETPTSVNSSGAWKPSDGDTTTFLEARLKRWIDYWAKGCTPK